MAFIGGCAALVSFHDAHDEGRAQRDRAFTPVGPVLSDREAVDYGRRRALRETRALRSIPGALACRAVGPLDVPGAVDAETQAGIAALLGRDRRVWVDFQHHNGTAGQAVAA